MLNVNHASIWPTTGTLKVASQALSDCIAIINRMQPCYNNGPASPPPSPSTPSSPPATSSASDAVPLLAAAACVLAAL